MNTFIIIMSYVLKILYLFENFRIDLMVNILDMSTFKFDCSMLTIHLDIWLCNFHPIIASR